MNLTKEDQLQLDKLRKEQRERVRRGADPTGVQLQFEVALSLLGPAYEAVFKTACTEDPPQEFFRVMDLALAFLLQGDWCSGISRGTAVAILDAALAIVADGGAQLEGDCNWGGLDERGFPLDEELDEDWHPEAMLKRVCAMREALKKEVDVHEVLTT